MFLIWDSKVPVNVPACRSSVNERWMLSVPIGTPAGQRHFCVGVYTVNGKAAGAYVRLSEKPLIDFSAVDAALLLEEDD